MANKRNEYPDWVEKYRGPQRTIRRTGKRYGLYKCVSGYDESGKPMVIQEYLGMITEKDGFIPKRTSAAPVFLEYGLSHLICSNLSRTLLRHTFQGDRDVVKLGIIRFILGTADSLSVRSSCLTFQEADRLLYVAEAMRQERITRMAGFAEEALRKKLPDPSEYLLVTRMLMLCCAEIVPGSLRIAEPPEEIHRILKKNRLSW